ncbi:hypothetical protein Pelo_5216 [Pelomyxa schiedti]|nr:hypothetical protein Pelo_5216 [Pelomyxa schiedti]
MPAKNRFDLKAERKFKSMLSQYGIFDFGTFLPPQQSTTSSSITCSTNAYTNNNNNNHEKTTPLYVNDHASTDSLHGDSGESFESYWEEGESEQGDAEQLGCEQMNLDSYQQQDDLDDCSTELEFERGWEPEIYTLEPWYSDCEEDLANLSPCGDWQHPFNPPGALEFQSQITQQQPQTELDILDNYWNACDGSGSSTSHGEIKKHQSCYCCFEDYEDDDEDGAEDEEKDDDTEFDELSMDSMATNLSDILLEYTPTSPAIMAFPTNAAAPSAPAPQPQLHREFLGTTSTPTPDSCKKNPEIPILHQFRIFQNPAPTKPCGWPTPHPQLIPPSAFKTTPPQTLLAQS